MAGLKMQMIGADVNLIALAEELRYDYRNADPFPHVVIDGLLNEAIVEKASKEFPDMRAVPGAIKHSGATDEKLASPRGMNIENVDSIKTLLGYFNSSEFIDFIQVLTGIEEKLVPDPHFIGGGMHQTRTNGYLKIHTDFAKHPETKLDRRINSIFYLSDGWEKAFGGELELWDQEMKECKKVSPIRNRLVIFNTNDFSNHGHPDPLKCPPSWSRNSIALYYYSNGRPERELKRKKAQGEITFYRERNDEVFQLTSKERALRIVPSSMLGAIRRAKAILTGNKSHRR